MLAKSGLTVSADHVGRLSLLVKVPSAPGGMMLSSSVLSLCVLSTGCCFCMGFFSWHITISSEDLREDIGAHQEATVLFQHSLPSLEPHSWCSPGVSSSRTVELAHGSWPLQTDTSLHCTTTQQIPLVINPLP